MTGRRIQEISASWQGLLGEEERLYQRCCELGCEPGRELERTEAERTPEKSAAVREWWSAANAVIWMHLRTRAQHNHELLPYPGDTLGTLANICEDISNGRIPWFVTDAAKSGRPFRREERHYIAYGVAYIEAVRDGRTMIHRR
jgi:hypothetical protein